MKRSILRTVRDTLVATTLPDGLLSLSKIACIVFVFCAATAIISPAQGPSFITLYSFGGGTDGANPAFVNLVQGKDGKLYGTTQVSSGTAGTVFKIATTPSKPTTLHVFCTQGYPCADGANPYAGLTLATNGKFYGTTTLGGKNPANGTVFQITSAGSFKTIYNFSGTADGSFPEAAPIQAKDGHLYGPTVQGGSSSDGTLYEMTTAGGLIPPSFSFDGGNGNQPYGRLLQGKDGNYYGTTAQVTSGDGTVFVIKVDGIHTLHTFKGTDGGYPIGGLIQATNGTFYGTTNTAGGNLQGGTVFSITAAGKFKTLHSFCAKSRCTDGSSPLASLIQASDGNLYGTTFYGGTNYTSCAGGCGTIFKITTAGKFTTLYNFCSQENCADGSQPKGGLVQATNGSFYGTTYYGGTYGIGTVFSLSDGLGPLAKILPTLGTAGATVMILGDNLTGATKVTFNGVPAAFTVVSGTEIKVIVPTGATTGTVEVVTPGGRLKSDAIFQVD